MARTIVGEIFLNTRAIDGGVKPDVQKIIDGAQNAAAKVPVTADTQQANQAVATLSAQIENQIGGAWQAAALEAAKFTATVVGIKVAIEGAINQLSGLFDQLAQAQAGFSAILGSESAGTALLNEIREFARVSPFVTQELVNYSQQLLGVGQSAESIVPLLKNTGDLIASVGGDTQNISRVLFTLTQIRSIGRLVGQDAIQLQSSLVPITKLLADFLGKTTAEVKKLQEQGAISADTVFAAISAAGQKVEGAMATATRNIAGARSVLQDTVTIMAQDSVFLNKVFDDIVQGILAFSSALGDNDALRANLDSLDESLTSLYEDLQPLLESFGQTGAQIALNSLDILASVLESLAAAINTIPPGALDAIGRGLAVLFALKAPFMLIRYAQSIERISAGLRTDLARTLPATAAGLTATGTAASRAAPQIERMNAATSRTITLLSGGAFALGLFADQLTRTDEQAKILGDTLTTAAIGAQLGAAFGVQGAAVGAAAGGAVGLITAFVGNARAEAEARSKELQDIGAKMADDILSEIKLTTPEFTSSTDFATVFNAEQVRNLTEQIEVYDNLVRSRQELQNEIARIEDSIPDGQLLNPEEFNRIQAIEAEIERIGEAIDGTKDSADTARSALNTLFTEGQFADALQEVTNRFSQLGNEVDGYGNKVLQFIHTSNLINDPAEAATARLILMGEETADTAEEFEIISQFLGQFGISLNGFVTGPLEGAVAVIGGELPSAMTRARTAILETTTAFTEAKKAADEFFNPFIQQINSAQAATTAAAGLATAADKLVDDRSVTNTLAYADALVKAASGVSAANEAIREGTGADAGVSFLTAQLNALRESMELTEPQFQSLLRNMGLLSIYNTERDNAFVGTVADLAEQTGFASDRLQELLPSLRGLTNEEVTIPVNVLESLEQLFLLTQGLREVPVVGQEMADQLMAEILAIDLSGTLGAQIEDIDGGFRALRVTAVSVFTEMGALIDELARKGLGYEDALRSANDTLLDIEARRNQQPNRNQQVQDQRNRAAIEAQDARQAAEAEAQRLADIAAREAERLQREAERAAEEAQREAERQQREAERLAEEQADEAERLRQALRNSAETIQDAMESASEAIRDAAQEWTDSIRERSQQEAAVPLGRLLRNAREQASNLEELNAGLLQLQSRGLSSDAASAIGLDNVTDLRQVRRLLSGSNADLAELSRLVALRDTNAEIIARREQRQETQATIVAAIIQAAQILGYEVSPEQAQALSLQFNITGNPSTAQLPDGIIAQLQEAGLLLRR